MAEPSGEAAVRQEYLAFARGQAAGVPPSYEALALAVADEHPSLLEGLVRVLPTRPRTDGWEPLLTALDGTPVGWSGPHGQSCD
jgi:hypothetical protein